MLKKSYHVKLLILVSLVPIVSFVVVGYLSYESISNLIADQKWVTHTHSVIESSNNLLVKLDDAETGQRGYILTGKSDFLQPYNSVVSSISGNVKDLQQLTADNPVQQSNINQLIPLIDQKMSLNKKTIETHDSAGLDAALAIVNQGQGKRTMDQIRVVISNIKNEENGLLNQRNQLSEKAAQDAIFTIFIGTVFATGATVISTTIFYKKLKEREKLEKTNIDLHLETEKIKERENTKAELAAMISHELKTPLVTISGYAEMLKEEGVLGIPNKEQINALDKIYSNSVKLERLISDILDAQKLDLQRMKFNKKEFSVNDFLKEMIEIHSMLMSDKNIKFVNFTSHKLTIVSDRDRLAQVFANLIKNAIDFVPRTNGLIEIGANPEDNKIVFHVKDNGSGIPMEKQKNLFQKFYQADTSLKRKHGGSGLGLTICKGIVEGLGGKIWFETEPKKGTIFYFSLPNNGTNRN